MRYHFFIGYTIIKNTSLFHLSHKYFFTILQDAGFYAIANIFATLPLTTKAVRSLVQAISRQV